MSTITCWDLAQTAIDAGASRILLYGLKGLAKSRYALDTLKTTHEHVRQCGLNEDIAVQELLGHYIPKGDRFEWHDGPVMQAYRGGYGLVVNEMGRASGAVLDMFLTVMDDPSVSMIALANGEDVVPGEKFQVIATSNSSPEAMDEALRDRFDSIIEVNRPHPKLIAYLNKEMKGMGEFIDRSYQDPKRAISPRRALAFISYSKKGVEESIAATLAFGAHGKDALVALKTINATGV